jgi:hypothetical protein
VTILAAIALLLLVLIVGIALIPVTLVQRYRVGTSRQRARGWLATVNVVGIGLSTALFALGAAITNVWVPHAFAYTVLGFGLGTLLGLVGLWLTRWDRGDEFLHFTPNRWLVLAILLAVAGRIGYGFWRAWQSWETGIAGGSWVVANGAAQSLAAGAVVLGYYLTYWSGVRRRFHLHRRAGESHAQAAARSSVFSSRRRGRLGRLL